MGGSEILLILLVVLILFGADKLPELARSIGKGLNEIRKASDEIKNEILNEANSFEQQVKNIKDEMQKEDVIDEMRKEIEDKTKELKG